MNKRFTGRYIPGFLQKRDGEKVCGLFRIFRPQYFETAGQVSIGNDIYSCFAGSFKIVSVNYH